MKKCLLLSIIGLTLLSFVGCATVHLTAIGIKKPAAMTSNVNKEFTIVRHFSRDLRGYFTIFNLVTISNPNVSKVIEEEITAGQGDAVINIAIKGQTTFIDGAVPVLLGILGAIIVPPYGVYASNLVGMRTYTVEGDVIKYVK